jgi:DNA transposition AAA+ family ATPase
VNQDAGKNEGRNSEHFSYERFFRDLELEAYQPIDFSAIEKDSKGLPDNFKPTSTFRLIVDRLEYAREVRAPLALVTGTHGAGKSTAFRYYAHHREVLMWECGPRYSEKHLMGDIVRELGVSAGEGWRERTSYVMNQLAASPRTFLLDEAQRLNYAGMDLLKYLADNSGSTFALAASPSLEKRIDRWEDISSRCTVRLRVSTISVEEFVELYQAEGFSLETLTELHRLSKGVLRTVHALFREIDAQLGGYSDKLGREFRRGEVAPAHARTLGARVIGQ